MHASRSAYAALELEPGADREAVEQAYRRLIKRYHPDRSGGDAERASEINRAYFELRRELDRSAADSEAPRAPVAPSRAGAHRPHPRRARARGRRRARPWSVLVLALGVLLVMQRETLAIAVPRWIDGLAQLEAPGRPGDRDGAVPVDSAMLDGPLNEAAISRSIDEALRLARSGDFEELAQQSRSCHRRLRSRPELRQLDRCAALDDAAVALSDGGPIGEMGAFSPSAVTARQLTAGSLLSRDYLAIERRLDRIRMTVQLALRSESERPLGRRRFLCT